MLKQTLAIAAVAAPLVIASAIAQQPAIKRTPLQTVDFPAGYNVVTAIAEVPAGSCAGRHTHPGVESSYVMEGPMVVKIEGKPDQKVKDQVVVPEGASGQRRADRVAAQAPFQLQAVGVEDVPARQRPLRPVRARPSGRARDLLNA